jgi:hypothetical protein
LICRPLDKIVGEGGDSGIVSEESHPHWRSSRVQEENVDDFSTPCRCPLHATSDSFECLPQREREVFTAIENELGLFVYVPHAKKCGASYNRRFGGDGNEKLEQHRFKRSVVGY